MEKKKEAKKVESKDEKDTKEEQKILDLILPFDEKQVRILGTYEEPWFVAKDVAEILGYKKTRNAIEKHVRNKNKKKIGEPQNGASNLQAETILINEAGLYSLILRSKLPSAEKFEDWVTSEVLPSLRKRGSYTLSSEMKVQFDTLNTNLQATELLLKEAEQEIEEKEEEVFKANRKYERLKEKREHLKFRTKNCIYVVENMKEKEPRDPKFGKSDDFNTTLRQYRRIVPYARILYLVFVEDNDLVERCIKAKFKEGELIVPANHEFVIKVNPLDLISQIEEIMKFLDLPYKVEEKIDLYNKAIEDDYENEVLPRTQE